MNRSMHSVFLFIVNPTQGNVLIKKQKSIIWAVLFFLEDHNRLSIRWWLKARLDNLKQVKLISDDTP